VNGRTTRGRTARGATPLDIVLLLATVAAIGLTAARVPELIDYQYRHACYGNRELMATELDALLAANREEVYHVAAAYVFRSNRAGVPSRMVVLLTPTGGGKWSRILTREIPGSLLPRNLSCPVDGHAGDGLGAIDYAYLHGAWRCVYDAGHN
jgi:hypothetical protein